jgi:hypothetical protein
MTVVVRMEAFEWGRGAWRALRSGCVHRHDYQGEVGMGHWHLRDWEWCRGKYLGSRHR